MKESLVLLCGCLEMMNTRPRQTMNRTLRATMFHHAAPPCTARMLKVRISSPAKVEKVMRNV